MTVPQSHLMADISDYQAVHNMIRYSRAGRRVIMLKAVDATDDAGATNYAPEADAAHACRLRVVHYGIVRFDIDPVATIDHYIQRIEPHWRKGDRMLIDLEEYSGHPDAAPSYMERLQARLTTQHKAPRAFGYTNEAYMAEAGKRLADAAPGWVIAAYDGRLLDRGGTPKLPRGTKSLLLGKQYTDGQLGAQPHTAPGIGPCDDTILTCAGIRELLGSAAPKLKRQHLPARRRRCSP